MSGPGFLPITLVDDDGRKQLGVTVDGTSFRIMPNANIYEKIPYIKKTHQFRMDLLDSNGKTLDVYNLPEGTPIYYSVGDRNHKQDIISNLDIDKYFIINTDTQYDKPRVYDDEQNGGGRKRKQSKYSSKKRSVKSRRSRNSRKRRYSRRR